MDLVRILTEYSDPSDHIRGRCCVGLALPDGRVVRITVFQLHTVLYKVGTSGKMVSGAYLFFSFRQLHNYGKNCVVKLCSQIV